MLSVNDLSWLSKACDIAKTSRYKMQMGAIVVKSGKPFGAGPNKIRNFQVTTPSPEEALNFDKSHWSIHAEAAALKRAGASAQGSTVYVVRLLKSGTMAMAKPCSDCAALLKDYKVSKVVYSTNDGTKVLRVRDL